MDVSILGSPAASAVQLSPGATSPAISGNLAGSSAAPPPVVSSTPTPVPVAATGIVTSGDSSSGHGAKTAAPSLEQVNKAVSDINASLAANGNANSVQFAVDPTSKRIVVQVLDPADGKVIRQIPSEEIIQMGMALGQKLGQVINQQA
jgi:flagellar protein FlaG